MADKELEPLFEPLFRDAYKKCFGKELSEPMSESESKLMAVEIEEKTGLVIGFKSIKNFSRFVIGERSSKDENPSLPTLDTLARYVLKAPVTTEADRKRDEDHHPYWYLYKKGNQKHPPNLQKTGLLVMVAAIFSLVGLIGLDVFHSRNADPVFVDDFAEVSVEALTNNSWMLTNYDRDFFRDSILEKEGLLTLYTLEGDNWPDTFSLPLNIRNMLLRKVDAPCFDMEAHLVDFLPQERWQQAGIILLEDTSFSGKGLRLSIAFNDFFGGYESPAELIVQGITSQGWDNPEEILHKQLFLLNSQAYALARKNMQFSALKIEKRADEYRFLLANGASNNVAFKEIGRHTFRMNPKYAGIFALKGNVRESAVIAARFDLFKMQVVECE